MTSLGRYAGRRLLLMVPTFLGITALTFAIAHFAPGDPLQLESELAVSAHRFGPEPRAPLIGQYVQWLGKLARLDLGRSLIDHRETKTKILEALPSSLVLAGLALLLAWAVAIPLGVFLATKPRSRLAQTVSASLSVASGLPSFWVAVLLLLLFANPRALEWFPFQGFSLLPVLCLTYPALAFSTRQVRVAMQSALGHDFIKAARARGTPEPLVIWRHAFRNALLPLVTVLGLQLPHLVSGSVVVERVFGIPGMGSLAVESVGLRDYPVVMGIVTLTALATMLAMLAVDVAGLLADPRLRGDAGR